MQKEFINMQPAWLRLPFNLYLVHQVLLSKIKDSRHRELLNVVSRNANRLRRLAEDILDVSRIESHSLSLIRNNSISTI